MKNIRLRFLSFDATKKPIVSCRVPLRAYCVMWNKPIFLFGVHSTPCRLYIMELFKQSQSFRTALCVSLSVEQSQFAGLQLETPKQKFLILKI